MSEAVLKLTMQLRDMHEKMRQLRVLMAASEHTGVVAIEDMLDILDAKGVDDAARSNEVGMA